VRLSLILSTYNQPNALAKVFAGLDTQTRWPDEIFIADDGSSDATKRLIESWRPKARCPVSHLWHPDKGFRKTIILNRAVNVTTGDYLVLLDGDCVPHPRFLSDHEKLAEAGCWVQGRRCFVRERWVERFSPGQTPIWRWMLTRRMTGAAKGLRLSFPIIRRDTRQRGIIGCNMGFWRADVVDVNGFDEDYIGWGIEDSDIGTRLYNLGRLRKFVYAHAIVYHLNHPMLPRDHFSASRRRLEETIRSRRVRCEHGLEQQRRSAAA
jgi:glycosyltransferase involved in cell wall biosynthesis